MHQLKDQHSTDDETLISLGEIENEISRKKYGLLWEEHDEQVDNMMVDNIPVFTEVPERDITLLPGEAYNFVLEGDNLHSLYLLEKTFKKRIDVIYIDPPYNTGAKDWKYNNQFVDDNDTFRHSKWLSLMSKRLQIARKLLTDTGIIVVTIDDYEFAPLRILMDDIFGIDNFLGTICIRNNPSGRSTVRGLSVNHEYALLYGASPKAVLGRMKHSDDQRSRYKESDAHGAFEWENFRKNGTDSDRKDRPKQYYPIFIDTTNDTIRIPDVRWDDATKSYIIEEETAATEIVLYPKTKEGTEKVWKYGIERARTIVGEILVKRTKQGYELYRKKYLNDEGSLPRTWWDKPDYSARDNGTRTLTNIFGPVKVFDFPKAPEAVKDCLIAANLGKNGIVLDFFAGSGTTGQAVLELNAEDGGNRRFILCSNNENGICENVTYQRCRTIITGKKADGSQYSAGIPANIKYYRTDFVSKEEEYLTDALLEHVCEMIQIEHGVAVDGKRYITILSEEDADLLEKTWEQHAELVGIYVSKNVLLTTAQRNIFETVELFTIPDYYFDFELKEVGESW